MAGTKVNNYAIGDSDIEAVMLTTDQIYKGQCHVSLTEMSTTTVPKIAAGSWIENNGTLFKFDSDETLTGSPSDGIVYIRIVPSTSTCTAEMTNTAPTWSDSKQGWYGTSGTANYRYIETTVSKLGSAYNKFTQYFPFKRVKNLISCTGAEVDLGESWLSSPQTIYYTLTPVFDLYSEVGTNYITINQTGYYEIIISFAAYIATSGANATKYITCSITKEDSDVGPEYFQAGNNSGYRLTCPFAMIYVGYITAGEKIRPKIILSADSTLSGIARKMTMNIRQLFDI